MKPRNAILWTLLVVLVVLVMSAGVQAQELREVPASEILEQIQAGEDVHLENVRITGELNVSEIGLETAPIAREAWQIENWGLEEELKIVESEMVIKDSVFENDVDFSNTQFKKTLDFRSASFLGISDFRCTNFSGGAEFWNTSFDGGANFWFADFSGGANFGDASFDGDADFHAASFGGDVDFCGASFGGDADFMSASFGGDADFRYIWFGGGANFEGTNFSDYARFWCANFSRGANFDGARFSRCAHFINAGFSGYSTFMDTNFSDGANFMLASFSGHRLSTGLVDNLHMGVISVYFDYKSLAGDDVDFMYARFGGGANFRDARFGDDAVFKIVSFSDGADFRDAKFGGDANFQSASFSDDADFRDARFGDDADFRDAKFNDDVSFSGTNFAKVVYFNGINFKNMRVSWSSLEHNLFYDGPTYIKLIKNFREMEQFKDADDAYYQYRRLSQADKKWSSSKLGDIFIWLYCGYGVRPWYAAVWTVAISFMCAFFYWLGNGIRRSNDGGKDDEQDASFCDVLYFSTGAVTTVCLMLLFLDCGLKPQYIIILAVAMILIYIWHRYKLRFFCWQNQTDATYKQGRKSLLTLRFRGLKKINPWQCGVYRLENNIGKKDASFCDAFYFSVTTFTTLGYGDWHPKNFYRILAVIEGLVGWLTLALFLVTLANVMIRP